MEKTVNQTWSRIENPSIQGRGRLEREKKKACKGEKVPENTGIVVEKRDAQEGAFFGKRRRLTKTLGGKEKKQG